MREIYCSQRRQRLQLLKYGLTRVGVTIRARGLKNVVGGRNHRAGFQAARDLRSNLALSDLTGKPVILAFYPADWSLVCGDQVTLYNEILPEFRKVRRGIVGHFGRRGVVHAAFARTVTCIFRCSPISRPRARSQEITARPRGPALAPITLVEDGDYARIARWRIP